MRPALHHKLNQSIETEAAVLESPFYMGFKGLVGSLV
jgi:hypothetical protein